MQRVHLRFTGPEPRGIRLRLTVEPDIERLRAAQEAASRPGTIRRDKARWVTRLTDPPERRRDVRELLTVVAERSYRAATTATVELVDDLCRWNAGRWRIDVSPDGASCERTKAPADLTMSAAELGAAYLGGPSPARRHGLSLWPAGSTNTGRACSARSPTPWSGRSRPTAMSRSERPGGRSHR